VLYLVGLSTQRAVFSKDSDVTVAA
jgi:hypothetical protein